MKKKTKKLSGKTQTREAKPRKKKKKVHRRRTRMSPMLRAQLYINVELSLLSGRLLDRFEALSETNVLMMMSAATLTHAITLGEISAERSSGKQPKERRPEENHRAYAIIRARLSELQAEVHEQCGTESPDILQMIMVALLAGAHAYGIDRVLSPEVSEDSQLGPDDEPNCPRCLTDRCHHLLGNGEFCGETTTEENVYCEAHELVAQQLILTRSGSSSKGMN